MSHRGEKGKYMVMGVLSSALDLAKAAVAHDEQGALPEKVLPYYKKVSTGGGGREGSWVSTAGDVTSAQDTFIIDRNVALPS